MTNLNSYHYEEKTYFAYDSKDNVFAHSETLKGLEKAIKKFGVKPKRKVKITTQLKNGINKYKSEEV